METDIIAAVATFRVFSSRSSAPSLTAPILPPSRDDRMATTLVCEGPLVLSKLATNEITYLQVNKFTRAIMPRSRIWRVSETEIVIPATSSNFWLITLKGSSQAVERFARIIGGLCKFERFYEKDESLEKCEHPPEDGILLASSDYSFEEPTLDAENQHVIDARQIIKKSDMSLRLNAVSSKNAYDRQLKSALSEDFTEPLFNFQEWPRNTTRHTASPSSLRRKDHSSTFSTLCDTGSSDPENYSLLEAVEAPASACYPLNTCEKPPSGEPITPQTVKPTNTLENKAAFNENESDRAIGESASQTAFLLSPPATPLATGTIGPPQTPQRSYESGRSSVEEKLKIDDAIYDHNTSDNTITDDPTADEFLDPDEFSDTRPSLGSTPNEKSNVIKGGMATDDLEISEKLSIPIANFKSAVDVRYAPRFLHPLIPTSHISLHYPQFNQPGIEAHNSAIKEEHHAAPLPPIMPRRALRRRDLLTIGPSVFHPEVTTVGGYIGLMAVKGLLRKT